MMCLDLEGDAIFTSTRCRSVFAMLLSKQTTCHFDQEGWLNYLKDSSLAEISVTAKSCPGSLILCKWKAVWSISLLQRQSDSCNFSPEQPDVMRSLYVSWELLSEHQSQQQKPQSRILSLFLHGIFLIPILNFYYMFLKCNRVITGRREVIL